MCPKMKVTQIIKENLAKVRSFRAAFARLLLLFTRFDYAQQGRLFFIVILFEFDEFIFGIIGKEVEAVEVFGEG